MDSWPLQLSDETLQDLDELAEDASLNAWYSAADLTAKHFARWNAAYMAALSPDTARALIAEIRRLRTALEETCDGLDAAGAPIPDRARCALAHVRGQK